MTSTIIALALLSAPSAWHQLPDGFGTPERIVLRGRVLEGSRDFRVKKGGLANLIGNLDTLETDEIAGALVEVEFADTEHAVRTDKDGFWTVTVRPKTKLPPGEYKAKITLTHPVVKRGKTARATVRVFREDAVILVSDIDDTVLDTGVRDRVKLVKNALLKSHEELDAVKGAPAAYAAAVNAGAQVIYLSGSPMAYHERLHAFLARKKLPVGPIFLKKLGQTSLTEQSSYKGDHLDALFKAFPKARFVLVGDSGEHDPEIYRAARARHEGRVAAIAIRKVPEDTSSRDEEKVRFNRVTIVRDDYAPRIIERLVSAAR